MNNTNEMLASLKASIDKLIKEKHNICIAVDGRCAAGKTTLSELLSNLYKASIIHMDDFFLPPTLRTQERYKEPGGNVHYERFSKEVVNGLRSGKEFTYKKFNCGKMNYNGTARVLQMPVIIVEGSYCLRPEFRDLYDLKVFMDISIEEQERRIRLRNGNHMYPNFAERWIPMEEKYFEYFSVRACCDFIFYTSS